MDRKLKPGTSKTEVEKDKQKQKLKEKLVTMHLSLVNEVNQKKEDEYNVKQARLQSRNNAAGTSKGKMGPSSSVKINKKVDLKPIATFHSKPKPSISNKPTTPTKNNPSTSKMSSSVLKLSPSIQAQHHTRKPISFWNSDAYKAHLKLAQGTKVSKITPKSQSGNGSPSAPRVGSTMKAMNSKVQNVPKPFIPFLKTNLANDNRNDETVQTETEAMEEILNESVSLSSLSGITEQPSYSTLLASDSDSSGTIIVESMLSKEFEAQLENPAYSDRLDSTPSTIHRFLEESVDEKDVTFLIPPKSDFTPSTKSDKGLVLDTTNNSQNIIKFESNDIELVSKPNLVCNDIVILSQENVPASNSDANENNVISGHSSERFLDSNPTGVKSFSSCPSTTINGMDTLKPPTSEGKIPKKSLLREENANEGSLEMIPLKRRVTRDSTWDSNTSSLGLAEDCLASLPEALIGILPQVNSAPCCCELSKLQNSHSDPVMIPEPSSDQANLDTNQNVLSVQNTVQTDLESPTTNQVASAPALNSQVVPELIPTLNSKEVFDEELGFGYEYESDSDDEVGIEYENKNFGLESEDENEISLPISSSDLGQEGLNASDMELENSKVSITETESNLSHPTISSLNLTISSVPAVVSHDFTTETSQHNPVSLEAQMHVEFGMEDSAPQENNASSILESNAPVKHDPQLENNQEQINVQLEYGMEDSASQENNAGSILESNAPVNHDPQLENNQEQINVQLEYGMEDSASQENHAGSILESNAPVNHDPQLENNQEEINVQLEYGMEDSASQENNPDSFLESNAPVNHDPELDDNEEEVKIFEISNEELDEYFENEVPIVAAFAEILLSSSIPENSQVADYESDNDEESETEGEEDRKTMH